jgi:hypothetical protein
MHDPKGRPRMIGRLVQLEHYVLPVSPDAINAGAAHGAAEARQAPPDYQRLPDLEPFDAPARQPRTKPAHHGFDFGKLRHSQSLEL